MVHYLVLALALLWSSLAAAQTVPGRFPANTVYGNPTGAEAQPRTATLGATFDSGFCATNGQVIGRVGGTWACVPTTNITGVYNVTDYGAVCDGTTNDTTAVQNAVDAWKAAGSVGIAILQGPSRDNRCRVTAPIDFTLTSATSPHGGIVRDLWLYGVFNYTGPVGTGRITAGGATYNGGGTGNFTATLTGGTGSGCTGVTLHTTAGVIDQVVSLLSPGCGTGYTTGDVLTVSGGNGAGRVTVDTLSGGAIIDAIGARFIAWENVTTEGDCTSVPNAGWALGRFTTPSADQHYLKYPQALGCWQFAGIYALATESTHWVHPLISANNTSGSIYGLVLDGMNHFNWYSAFKTMALAVDTSQSFLSNQFNNLTAQTNSTTAGTPLWMGHVSGHRFSTSYLTAAAGASCGAIIYANGASTESSQLTLDIHIETTPASAFCLKGNSTARVLSNFEYRDAYAFPTSALFTPDAAISTVTAYGLTVDVTDPASWAGTVFGSPSKWTVTPNRITVPVSGNYVAPGTERTGGWICIGSNACTPSGGAASTTNFLRGDGTWTVPPGTAGGTIASAAAGQVALYTGTTAIGGSANLTWSSPTLTIGAAGVTGRASLAGSTSGTTTLQAAATASGNLTLPARTATVATTTGTLTSNNCADFDASGNIVDAGAPCGVGTVNSGTANQVAYYASSTNAVSGNANHTISTGTMTHGVAGSVVGSSAYANATSGTITLTPTTGALGSAVLTLPARTANVATTTGTLTSGRCTELDGSGNIIQSGAACGVGTVNSGTANQLAYYVSSTNAVSGNANHTVSSGDMLHGLAGSVVGSNSFANATSGTIKVQPQTGALGSTVLTLPARTANVATSHLVTTYTTVGNSTHTFATGATLARFIGCGAGGAGGSGGRITSGTQISGGGGGGGGGCFDRTFTTAELGGTSVRIFVGTGGTGPAYSGGAGPADGNDGPGGTLTCVSSAASCTGTLYLVGGPGGGGAGGVQTAASGGGGGGCPNVSSTAGNYAGGSATTTAAGTACTGGNIGGSGSAGTNNTLVAFGSGGGGGGLAAATIGGTNYAFGASGGASGGSVTSVPGSTAGAAGGWASQTQVAANIATAGTVGNAGGTAGASISTCVAGGGGGSGGGNHLGNGGAGGAGIQGGGGGGGGSSLNANTPGAGGSGGNGFVCVTEYF